MIRKYPKHVFALAVALALFFLSAAVGGDEKEFGRRVAEGAREAVQQRTVYDGSGYIKIPYPNGDIDPSMGVCTDLVIRAFRKAGVDLQKELHEDRRDHPEAYPTHIWTKKEADPNIDHRRCQNLTVFFKRKARSLTTKLLGEGSDDWEAGDVVFFVRVGRTHPWHVGIVSGNRNVEGRRLMYHLFPPRAHEAPITKFAPIHSHFRWRGNEK